MLENVGGKKHSQSNKKNTHIAGKETNITINNGYEIAFELGNINGKLAVLVSRIEDVNDNLADKLDDLEKRILALEKIVLK